MAKGDEPMMPYIGDVESEVIYREPVMPHVAEEPAKEPEPPAKKTAPPAQRTGS